MIYRNVILLVLMSASIGCRDTSERSQPQPGTMQENSMAAREDAGSAPHPEGMMEAERGAPMITVRVPDDAEMQAILRLQQDIVKNPNSDSLRRELGYRAIDAGARVIWTVGAGRVTDPASAIALSNAERVAWIDGSRWAAYLIEWQKNNFSTPFGSLQAQVPGSMVERKSMGDSLCVALVKTSLP